MPKTILIVDDHPVFRQGLRLLLEKEKDLKVVGEAGDGQEAIDWLRELSPDIVVMDITMPNLDGIEATRRISEEFPDTRVVALSVHSGKRFVRDMLHAGAAGYILKESVPEEIIQGIRTVLAGEVYLSQSISSIVVSDYKKLLPETDQAIEAPLEPILRTKLHRPPISADIIPRLRLIELLEEGRHRPMTLISAPAGYGKSILASQWLETCACPGAWVSLDENDNDLRMFLTYLLEAVQNIFPAATLETKTLLQASRLPPVKVLTHNLLNDMEQVEEPFILVLDDYHRINEAAVQDLLVEMLRYPSPMLHLAVLTRRDPPLPIAHLRAGGQLTEIAMAHLRFTLEETAAFLERSFHVSTDEKTASILAEKTDGWVTALRLATLSLLPTEEPDRLLQVMNQDSRYVQEYLIREVLSKVQPAFRKYLMETSILDRFCAPLCEALGSLDGKQKDAMDELSGQAFIDWLEKTNLFVIPLDETRRWFRYHHLFRDLLQRQIKRQSSSEEISMLHSRACEWFAENGFLEEALHHALAANDIPFAVELVKQHRQSLMNEEQWNRMERLLGLFTDQVVETYPELLVMKAWISYHNFEYSEMVAALDRAESLINAIPSSTDPDNHLRGDIDTMRGVQFYFQAEGQRALSFVQQALERIPPENALILGQAKVIQYAAYQMIGDPTHALEIAHGRLAEDSPPNAAFYSRELLGICFVHWLEGDLFTLRQTADQALKHTQKYNLPETLPASNYFLGIANYHTNDMISSEKHLTRVVEEIYRTNVFVGIQSCFALSMIYNSSGRTEKAREMVEKAVAFSSEIQNPYGIMTARAFKTEMDLLHGRMNEAHYWARQFNPEPFRSMPWFYVPQFTLVKVLLAEDTSESREQAADLLDRLHHFVLSIHNRRVQMDVLALQALLHNAQGEEPAALEKLTESLALAEPGGFIRNFVDLGPPMADLLKRLIKKDVAVDYIEKLLAAFRIDEQVVALEVSESQVASKRSVIPQPLVEPLTNRELDILELLADRLQTKEMAEKLFISPETVKSHLKNIYQKFNVKNRRQAVSKAKDLGILSRD